MDFGGHREDEAVKNIYPPYLTCRRSLVTSNKTSRISIILRTRCGGYTLRS